MKPRKRGQLWEISYRCPGYSKPIYERFPSFEAAKLRIAEIQYEKSIGQLRPPRITSSKGGAPTKKFITVGELLDEYVTLYGLNHWGDSYLSYSRHRIEHYIKPYLGNVILSDLTAHDLDLYYDSLRSKPAVALKGHKNTNRTVSPQVIEKVHSLLRSALNQAVVWGYIETNPALKVTLAQYRKQPRKVWSTEESQTALSLCRDPVLHLAMLLALGCSMRIGEILGLTWDCVDLTPEHIENGTARLLINKELKRCNKNNLSDLEKRGRSTVLLTFPELKQQACKTSLVLKAPKTESSIRTVYLPKTVAAALQEAKANQEKQKMLLGDIYSDFGLVLAQGNGRPYEERQIADRLRSFIKENDLPPVVFHSLRHCSTSIKLRLSSGNIKAVQGDTGHAQARMVTDVYAHINNADRKELAHKIEAEFFQQLNSSPSKAESIEDATEAYQLLQKNPEIAKLIIATLKRTDPS